VKAAQASRKNADSAKPDAALLTGKIALEEHFSFPEIESYARYFSPEVWRQIS